MNKHHPLIKWVPELGRKIKHRVVTSSHPVLTRLHAWWQKLKGKILASQHPLVRWIPVTGRKIRDRLGEWYTRFSEWLVTTDFQAEIKRVVQNNPGLQSLPYWGAAALVGLLAVAYAEVFEALTSFAKNLLVSHPYFLFIISPLSFLGAWWLVERHAPRAGGSGIPQVRAAINVESHTPQSFITALVGLKTAGIKVASSFLCVLGGGAIGREGPTIQIAASVFHATGQQSRKVWRGGGHQPWLIAGGAAGLAAAFNTPLGGIVFAIEELAPQYFSRFKTMFISAVIIAGMVAQWVVGRYLYFGFPKIESITGVFIFHAAFMGIVCGVGGGYFAKALLVGTEKVRGLTQKQRGYFAAGAGFSVATLAYFSGVNVMGGGAEVVRSLLFEPDATASWHLVLGRSLASFVTYATGAAGGIFSPSLSIGGCIGSWLDSIFGTESHHLMILLGMTAFLSAVTRAPFTALVLVFEMTDRHSAIFYLMVASLSANVIARLVEQRSFYDTVTEQILDEVPPKQEKLE